MAARGVPMTLTIRIDRWKSAAGALMHTAEVTDPVTGEEYQASSADPLEAARLTIGRMACQRTEDERAGFAALFGGAS